jgi:hypothetical protein
MAATASFDDYGGLCGRRLERRAAPQACALARCESAPAAVVAPPRAEPRWSAPARQAEWRAVIAAWVLLLIVAAAGFWALGRLDRAGPLPDSAVGLRIPTHLAAAAGGTPLAANADER